MLPATLLAKKRDGGELAWDEIRFLVDGFVAGRVTDYQMSAFAMAVAIRGMTPEETAALTTAMLDSGERLEVVDSHGEVVKRGRGDRPRVDKHSTGGLGDKVSLILAPLMACHGVHVPMISGRGLGLSGGTLDKLEAIPGFCVQLDQANRQRMLREIGCFIVGASSRVAPADRQLYALRDVTGTVESIPLITASILSKKCAASLDRLVMDVKVGSAAFMKTFESAKGLAESLVRTGHRLGLGTTALLTDMDQPLGEAVGNAIEVNESLDVLRGEGPSEVAELTVELAAQGLVDVGVCAALEEACGKLWASLRDGSAAERFEKMVAAQGGRLAGELALAPATAVSTSASGYVAAIDCELLGRCVVELGGGRTRADDRVDPSVGLRVRVRIGERVERDDRWLDIHARDAGHWPKTLDGAIKVSDDPVPPHRLVIDRVTADAII